MDIKIPKELLVEDIRAYSQEGFDKKEAFHRQGKKFLKALAAEMGLLAGEFDVRSNKGGIAVSGEVTLHADQVYIQLRESAVGQRGVHVLYRTCDGRKDYSGGTNHWQSLRHLASNDDALERFVLDVTAMAHAKTERPRLRG